jgi:PIN domain nuclease of toxin-antitoxin system
MGRFLLDTCTFLWILEGSSELSDRARMLFQDPDNEIYLSAVSAWEIAIKYHIGRLPLPLAPEKLIPQKREEYGIEFLPLEEQEALTVHRLPDYHRDPFDRMLIAQAIVRGLTLLTPDEQINRYAVLTAW